MASGEKQVAPGGETKIAVKVSTKGYGGRKIIEPVFIYTNDKKQPRLRITVTGLVEKAAEIIPQRAMLKGPAGKLLATQIKITPTERFPFKIFKTRTKNGNFIKYSLEEHKESGKFFYLLILENTRLKAGLYSDVIYLETDNKNFPILQIYVIGYILEKEPDTRSKR